MIFKTVLKYKIYEWCLEALVNKLINNFQIFKYDGTRLSVRDLRPGTHLSTIILNIPGWAPVFFYDCKIIRTTLLAIDHEEGDPENKLWDVGFTCSSAAGSGYAQHTSFNNHGQVQNWNMTDGTNELEFIV